jgi:hypothetical protein
VSASQDFLSRLESITANGDTPTGEALRSVARNLPASLGARAIVLISDGESNCTADACGTAQELVAEGFDVQVHAFGFAVSDEGAAELGCIARTTGGEYLGIAHAAELTTALDRLAEPVLSLSVGVNSSLDHEGSVAGLVAVSAHNEGIGDFARNVTLSVTVEGDAQTPLPVAHLGNIAAGDDSGELVWRIPQQGCESSTIQFTVTATADNAEPIVHAGSVGIDESTQFLCDALGDSGPDPAPLVLTTLAGLLIAGSWLMWRP